MGMQTGSLGRRAGLFYRRIEPDIKLRIPLSGYSRAHLSLIVIRNSSRRGAMPDGEKFHGGTAGFIQNVSRSSEEAIVFET